MNSKRTLILGYAALVMSHALALASAPMAPPIKDIDKVRPNQMVFKDATRAKPIVLKSEKEASKYFEEKALAALTKQVDFKEQIVLIFAWRGSGQDKMTYAVAESFPEQITFSLKPGRTKDLRPHIEVYALRSNVKWSVRKGIR